MQQLSFKNRIASHYIITTALLIFVVFFVIYSIVKLSVYNHLNTDIAKEVKNHLNEIGIKNNTFYLMHAREWEEREHNTVDVNPVFIQFLDKNGDVIEKSPNLKNEVLYFNKDIPNNELFDTKILGNKIRQIQVPIFEGSKIIGYLIIAMSLEGALIVLQNLEEILSDDAQILCEEITKYITENRLLNVISKIGTVTPKDYGKLLGLYCKDTLDDFLKAHKTEYEKLEKFESKAINKFLNSHAGKLVTNYLKNI